MTCGSTVGKPSGTVRADILKEETCCKRNRTGPRQFGINTASNLEPIAASQEVCIRKPAIQDS